MKQIASTEAPAASLRVAIDVVESQAVASQDLVTIEEPLEIRLVFGPVKARIEQSLSVTMRTPGNDLELALGFLAGEAIIRQAADVQHIEHCGPPSPDKGIINVVKVELHPRVVFDATHLTRHTFTTSSCGVCGKASLEAVRVVLPDHPPAHFEVAAATLKTMPERLNAFQTEFARTGGLHASATFDAEGAIDRAREDVGRHNALDKLIGSYLLDDAAVLRDRGLILSGRASFELVQKAAVAGISLIAAIGPPSSLAIELAQDQSITLVGFLKADRFNLYCGTGVTA